MARRYRGKVTLVEGKWAGEEGRVFWASPLRLQLRLTSGKRVIVPVSWCEPVLEEAEGDA